DVVDSGTVLLVLPNWQFVKSMVQSPLQRSAPPGEPGKPPPGDDAQVASPKSSPSHASSPSRMPLPQTPAMVEVVVDVLLVAEVVVTRIVALVLVVDDVEVVDACSVDV